MRPDWRSILIGWLAERATQPNPVYLTREECLFIDRLMGGGYPLQDGEIVALLTGERNRKPGFYEYCGAVYRDFEKVVEGEAIEFQLTKRGALALLAMACDPEIYEKVVNDNAGPEASDNS